MSCFETKTELYNAVRAGSPALTRGYWSSPYDFENSTSPISIKYGYPIGNWCVTKIQDFSHLFNHFVDFNLPLNGWDTRSATDMSYMFENTINFNQSLYFHTSNVTNMEGMFRQAHTFNAPLYFDDTSKVLDMSLMFYKASSFNQPLDNFDITNLKSTYKMFYEASHFRQNLCCWAYHKNTTISPTLAFAGTSCPQQYASKFGGSANPFQNVSLCYSCMDYNPCAYLMSTYAPSQSQL